MYEFLYRGRPGGLGRGAGLARHHRPACDAPSCHGAAVRRERSADPSTSRGCRFPLASVLEGIDTAALAGRDAALADARTSSGERDAALAERDALAAQLAALQAAPAAISDRQFFQALAQAGAITPEEALAAVMTGTLPATIEAAVSSLPKDQQFAARMLLSGATHLRARPPDGDAARRGARLRRGSTGRAVEVRLRPLIQSETYHAHRDTRPRRRAARWTLRRQSPTTYKPSTCAGSRPRPSSPAIRSGSSGARRHPARVPGGRRRDRDALRPRFLAPDDPDGGQRLGHDDPVPGGDGHLKVLA